MWMNEFDVAEASYLYGRGDTPNLYQGALVLQNLVGWTNANSDGWPYWSKPSNAAKRLQALLTDRTYAAKFGHDRSGAPLTDITDAELKAALSPIKSFLTKQGVAHETVLV